jgi:hypothetical protein
MDGAFRAAGTRFFLTSSRRTAVARQLADGTAKNPSVELCPLTTAKHQRPDRFDTRTAGARDGALHAV